MSGTLAGKVCIITGANTGIGRITALEMARMGAHTILACRSEEKGTTAVEEIKTEVGHDNIAFLPLDLASLDSVRNAAAKFRTLDLPLHLLINNAGVAGSPGITQDGFERTFGVNHLGHFLLTLELLPLLKSSAPARIINVASKAHFNAKGIDFAQQQKPTATITGLLEYNVSKLANVLFTQELSRRLQGSEVTAYSLHPGVVASDVWRYIPPPLSWLFALTVKPFMISNEQGAKTTLYCATSPHLAGESGKYYDRCQEQAPSRITQNEALARALWEHSTRWVGFTEAASL